MATRNEWNSYQVGSGINIWGNPEFKGSPVFAGGLEFGDAITDSLVLKGRVATGSIAGSALSIDANYTHGELIEIRASVDSWAGVGSSFHGLYMRINAGIDATGKAIYAEEVYAANADGIDIATLQTFLFNTMGKGNSTITLMRGGEIKCEWLATDVVTNARALQIEFMGLAAPTNPVYGIWFEKDSAAGAMAAMFYEIRMKSGMCILSGSGAPAMAAGKGSLYLRTDGSAVNDRIYVNTDGSTTWTHITTGA